MRSIRHRLTSIEKRLGRLRLDPLETILEYDSQDPDLDLDTLIEEHFQEYLKKYPNIKGYLFCVPKMEDGPE